MIDTVGRSARGWLIDKQLQETRLRCLPGQTASTSSLTTIVFRQASPKSQHEPDRCLSRRVPPAGKLTTTAQWISDGQFTADVHVISLHGDFDHSRLRWLEEQFAEANRSAPAALIIDCSDAREVEPSFLAALCRIQQRMVNEKPRSTACIVAPRNHFTVPLEAIEFSYALRVFGEMASARRYVEQEDQVPA